MTPMTIRTVPDLDHPVRYLEQAVGSGKTGLVISTIKAAKAENHIFVAPTVELGREVNKRLSDAGVANVHHLFHEKTSESVFNRAMGLINGRQPSERHVLILTGKTFRAVLSEIAPILAQKYHLYLDEGMNAVEYCQLQADRMIQYAELLSVSDEGLLVPARGSKELLENVARRDDRIRKQGKENLLTKNFVQIADLVTCGLYDVRATMTESSISVVALLRPDRFRLFKSVTMVEANWSQSILAMTWSERYGVRIEPFPNDYQFHDTHSVRGSKMEIYYCLHADDRATNENLRRDIVTGEKSQSTPAARQVMSMIAKSTHDFFADRGLDYCWSANKSFKNRGSLLVEKNRMPAISAGLNQWEHLDNVAALACINPPTWVKKLLLAFLGVNEEDSSSSDAVYRKWRFAHTYQTVGRCSLRNRNSSRPNVVVVLSRQCAEDLAVHFKGALIGGCVTNLPSFRELDAAKRQRGAEHYDASDHKAWSVWRKRHPTSDLTKAQWFESQRRFQKMTGDRRLAA